MKHLLGETSANEQKLVQEWLRADAANQVYFDELRKVWETSLRLSAASTVDENEAWQRFRQRIDQRDTAFKTSVIPIARKRFAWLRIAAAIALIVGLSSVTYWIFNDRGTRPLIVQTAGNTLSDTLPDGSVVTLNKASSISYPSAFSSDKRPVTLKGEAFFNVKPDKRKPFVITVNDLEVTVVGTSFNIKAEDGRTDVIVETGIVRVTKNGKTIELRANEHFSSKKEESFGSKEEVTDNLHGYYRSKVFICDETPLHKLVAALEEAYHVRIYFKNPETMKNQRINITLNNEPIDRVMELISTTLNIKIIKTDDGYVIEE